MQLPVTLPIARARKRTGDGVENRQADAEVTGEHRSPKRAPPSVSAWQRLVMHHLDPRTDQDRQQVLRSLQGTRVSRPRECKYALAVGGVGLGGQAGSDATEHLASLLRRRVVRNDPVDDRRARVVGSIAQRLWVDGLVH